MQKNDNLKRHVGFDILKCICAFLVICIHAPFPGEFGKYIVALSRIAVPIFFMITGFYYKRVECNNKENDQIYKVVKLILLSTIIYIIFDIIKYSLSGKMVDFISYIFSFKTIIKLVVLNESPFSGHLWYMNSLLYVLIIYKFLLRKEKSKKIMLVSSIILLIVDLCLGKYSLVLFNNEISYFYLRNFVFVGLPYFTIGYYLNKYLNNRKKNNTIINIILINIFVLTNIAERYLLIKYNVNSVRDSYISTIFLSIQVFILFYNISKDCGLLNIIGKKYSTYIYIFHPIVITILLKVLKGFSFYSIYMYIQPLIVFVVTWFVSYIYVLIIPQKKSNN